MAKSLNKVQLIGNLTRDPELRYTPQGSAVCTFSIATNRQWKTESGEQKDLAEFHRIVSWTQLAEICAKLLKKGMRAYVEGRLQTRSWQGSDGAQKQTTEIVISDMIILDSRGAAPREEVSVPEDFGESQESPTTEEVEVKSKKAGKAKKEETEESAPADEDIPF